MTQPITLLLSGLSEDVMALIVGKVDLGSAATQGRCQIRTGSGTVLVNIDLNAPPAFGLKAGNVYEALGVPHQGVAIADGLAARAVIQDRDGISVFDGAASVIGGNGFAQLDKVEIETGDVVTLTVMEVTGPPNHV